MKQTNDELYQLYLIKQVGESPYNFVYDEDGKIIGRIVYLDGEEVIQEWNEDIEEEAEEKRKKAIEEKEKKEEEEKRQKEEYEKRMKELECEFFNNLNIYTTTASGTAVSGEWKGSGHAWAEIYMDSHNGTGWFKFDYHLTSKKLMLM